MVCQRLRETSEIKPTRTLNRDEFKHLESIRLIPLSLDCYHSFERGVVLFEVFPELLHDEFERVLSLWYIIVDDVLEEFVDFNYHWRTHLIDVIREEIKLVGVTICTCTIRFIILVLINSCSQLVDDTLIVDG